MFRNICSQKAPAALETKFNPNHDPSNGQFTSGDGAGGGGGAVADEDTPSSDDGSLGDGIDLSAGDLSDGVFRPDDDTLSPIRFST